MSISQCFKTAWRNLQANRWRFVQALLGMVIGVAAVVVILSVQQALVNRIDAVYREYSPSLMSMGTYRPADSSQNFTESDMERVAAEHPEYITAVSPVVYLYESPVQYEGQDYEEFGAMGVGDRFMEMSPVLKLAEGHFLQPMEISREQRVCVVTQRVAEEAMGGEAMGKTLRIMGENFKVVGVIADVEDDQEQFNGAVYIPYTVAKRLQPERIITMRPESGYSGDYYLSQYYVNANGMDNIANARIAVQEALQEVYGDNTIHYSASFRYFREGELTPIYSMARKLLAGAGVVLLLGGVGIMNVMLAAVSERTREIGIRKAFGATLGDIRRQFIIEAAGTSLLGGLLGVVLGIAGSFIACAVLELPAKWLNFPALLLPILGAVAIAILLGVVFGLYPAAKAAKMEPVTAMNKDE